jgi:hypothetical protein
VNLADVLRGDIAPAPQRRSPLSTVWQPHQRTTILAVLILLVGSGSSQPRSGVPQCACDNPLHVHIYFLWSFSSVRLSLADVLCDDIALAPQKRSRLSTRQPHQRATILAVLILVVGFGASQPRSGVAQHVFPYVAKSDWPSKFLISGSVINCETL